MSTTQEKRLKKSKEELRYFGSLEFRSLVALAEVVIMGEEELLTPEEIALNVDRYMASFDAKNKWLMKLVLIGMQLYPLLSLKPPLSSMSPEDRLAFLKKRFYQDVTLRVLPSFWRVLVQGMIRMAKQLCYLGYYNDPRTFESVNYVPFSQREDTEAKLAKSPVPERMPLKVHTSADISGDSLTADVLIVGSGAAASVLAYGLAKAGREVFMVERGQHVEPSEFSEDEVEMFGRLYSDGALQLSRDFRFQVLQGSCVGGTTVVNNAVCFDLPPHVLEKWNNPQGLNAGLDEARLWQSFNEVRRFIGVERQNHANLNKGDKYFTRGVRKLNLNVPPNEYETVEANIHECLGCGYCNIGCTYGKKLSMLDTVLPMTQRDFGQKALKIVAGCTVEKLRKKGNRVTGAVCRFSDGRRIEVNAKTVVVCAGAVSSSILLSRSRIGGKQVGKYLSFNMGSPITAVFDDVVNSYDGLQISHYLEVPPDRGFVIESWYNPPVAQSLSMPGWFEDHFNNMRRFDRMAAVGVLVPTESNAEVKRAGLTGREINYTPTPEDLKKLLDGLVLAGEIFLAGDANAVLPSTFEYYEFKTSEELRQFPTHIKGDGDLFLGTGHPQGGNILSQNQALGVVNPEFRVHGYENLFLCDASVFPSSIGVNPQLTVMALAHYAVPFVAES